MHLVVSKSKSEATETLSLDIDGVAYEIDLNDDNAQDLPEQLTVWTDKARRVGGRRNPGTRSASSAHEAAKFRAWAKGNGYAMGERGRIPKEIRKEYNAVH